MNNGNHSPNYGTKMEEGGKSPMDRGVYRGAKIWGRGMRGRGPCGMPGSGSALVGDAVMGRSQGSGHWSWQRIQPHWNRAQEARRAPANPACGSLTCHPIMCRTHSCTLCAGPVLHTSSWSRDCPNPVSYTLQASWPQQPP